MAKIPGGATAAVQQAFEQQDREIEELKRKVEGLEEAIGALMACIVRVGIEGRVPVSNDTEKLGMGTVVGEVGIPKGVAKTLSRYASRALAAEKNA